MLSLFKNKSKKTGDSKTTPTAWTNEDGGWPAGHAHHGQEGGARKPRAVTSQDDLAVRTQQGQGKKKAKGKVNPYATTKLWRPITMTTSVSRQEDAVHSFSNFHVLVGQSGHVLPDSKHHLHHHQQSGQASQSDSKHQYQPGHAAVGHSGQLSRRGHPLVSRTVSHPVTASELDASLVGDSLPPDYLPHPSPATPHRSSRPPEGGTGSPAVPVVKMRLGPRSSAPSVTLTATSDPLKKRSVRPTLSSPGHAFSTTGHAFSTTGHAYSTTGHALSSTSHAFSSPDHALSSSGHALSGHTLSFPSHALSSPPLPVYGRTRSVSVAEGAGEVRGVMEEPHPSRRLFRSLSAAPTFTSTLEEEGGEVAADYPGSRSSPSSAILHPPDYDVSEEGRGHSVIDSSYEAVSGEAASGVRDVLTKTYDHAEGLSGALQDVEGMLTQLTVTMETARTSYPPPTSTSLVGDSLPPDYLPHPSPATSHRSSRDSEQRDGGRTVQELQAQTKRLVLDSKRLVTAVGRSRDCDETSQSLQAAVADRSRDDINQSLQAAMHTLARVLLHGQAAMVHMRGTPHGQRVGQEVVRVTLAFKGTLTAACSAVDKVTSQPQVSVTSQPHVTYLMRQAANLAALLSTLLKTLSTLQHTSV